MELEQWLRRNNMETKAFAEMVGCSRKAIWRVKTHQGVEEATAKKIFLITGGKVQPIVSRKGKGSKPRPLVETL